MMIKIKKNPVGIYPPIAEEKKKITNMISVAYDSHAVDLQYVHKYTLRVYGAYLTLMEYAPLQPQSCLN